MSHDPIQANGTAPGVDLWHCMFCSSWSLPDLVVDAYGELKQHIRIEHPSDYAVVMGAVDETIRRRDRQVKDAVAASLHGRRN